MATIPTLALIPSGVKATKVYSVLPTDGTGDFDFTRSGSATRVNSQGLIELVDSNVPRLNYPLIDGVVQGCPSLLLEPTSTNLIPYSEDFSQSAYTRRNCTITQNYAISPYGTQDATKVVANGSDAAILDNIGVTSGTTYTLSVYLRVESGTLDTTISLGSAGFPDTLGDGGRVKNITITEEWQRFTITSTADASVGSDIGIIGGFGGFNSGDSVLIWGAQLEAGSYPTSYIPTNGSIATRSAERCNGAGDASTFNDSEGVLFAEISPLVLNDTSRDIEISDGGSNRLIIQFNASGAVVAIVIVNGVLQTELSLINSNINLKKIAFKYKQNDFSLWVNGLEVSNSTTGNVFTQNTLSRLDFNKISPASLFFYGNIKQIQYFNTALTDQELQQLTTL